VGSRSRGGVKGESVWGGQLRVPCNPGDLRQYQKSLLPIEGDKEDSNKKKNKNESRGGKKKKKKQMRGANHTATRDHATWEKKGRKKEEQRPPQSEPQ